MAKPARRSVGDEFRKSVRDEEKQKADHAAAELARRQQETTAQLSRFLSGIAGSAESDVAKLPHREDVRKDYEIDVGLRYVDRAAVEKSPGFRALEEKCREMDIDFSWQARSYRDIDMTDNHYTHEDVVVVLRPTMPFRENGSRYEPYDPPRSYGSLGP